MPDRIAAFIKSRAGPNIGESVSTGNSSWYSIAYINVSRIMLAAQTWAICRSTKNQAAAAA